MRQVYPIMLNLRDRPVIVVGGSTVAAEKALALVNAGANVTALAADPCPELEALAERKRITLRRKPYEPGDLHGALLVVAAVTYEPELVEAVWRETRANGQLTNIVDVPARCDFLTPSILRRGALTVAVSTSGAAPSLAKRIRQRLEVMISPAYGAYLELATAARARLLARGASYDERDAFFANLETSPTLARLEAGDHEGAAQALADVLARHGVIMEPQDLPQASESSDLSHGASSDAAPLERQPGDE